MVELRKGTIIEVAGSFDEALCDLGDRGFITRGPEEKGGPALFILTTRSTGGTLPLYNCDLDAAVQEGRLRVVQQPPEDADADDYLDHYLEPTRRRARKRTEDFYRKQGAYRLSLVGKDLKTDRDRAMVDDWLVQILQIQTYNKLWTLAQYYVIGRHYDDAHEALKKSAHRLVAAGKILPFKGDGPLYLC